MADSTAAMTHPLSVARAEVHFSGHVQGVGFRYSVLQVAKGYELTGFVENLGDGRVHLVAEGDTHEIDAFVAEIVERMHGYIRKTERSDAQGARAHVGFIMR